MTEHNIKLDWARFLTKGKPVAHRAICICTWGGSWFWEREYPGNPLRALELAELEGIDHTIEEDAK